MRHNLKESKSIKSFRFRTIDYLNSYQISSIEPKTNEDPKLRSRIFGIKNFGGERLNDLKEAVCLPFVVRLVRELSVLSRKLLTETTQVVTILTSSGNLPLMSDYREHFHS